MAGQLKLRRGTTSQLANFIGLEGELTYDTALKSLVLHDGVTLGGVKIPYLSNDLVPSTMLPTATESVIGASKIATTEITQEGTNDTDFITALKLQQKLTSTIFGEGQDWVDVTSQRIVGTTYTNTTGKPLLISVVTRPNSPSSSSSVHLIVDGKIIIGSASYGSNIYVYNGASTIVPKDKTYSFSTYQQNYLYFLEFS